nr:Ycf48-like protein [uncultured bacterium]
MLLVRFVANLLSMNLWFALMFAVTALVGASPRPQVDPNLFAGMRWRNVGPSRGGRVTAVVGVAGQPLVYYFGGTGGGVWKTENAGISWFPVSDGYFKTGSVGAIEVAPSNPNIIYAGMGEACLRANLSAGDGVYKSTDAGKSWTHVGLDETSQIGRVLVDPHNPDLVYVAAIGHPYGPNTDRGVFRSKDGGKTWQKVLYVNDKTGAADLSMDPVNPKIIYAATWQVLRAPWDIVSGGPGSGLYKTTDGGDHWTRLTEGLPASEMGKIGVAVSPADANVVYAVVPAGADHEEGGIYRSGDAGKTWKMMSSPPEVRLRDYYYGHIFADPKNVDTIYTFRKEFMKSTDGGRSWQELRLPHGDFHDLWIDPNDSRRMINGNDGGATITFDGGRSWSSIDNQPTAQFYTVVTDDQQPYRLYGAQQDSTTVSISSRAAAAATEWYVVGGGESGHIAPSPDGNAVYAGSYFGKLTRYDRKTNEVHDITIWPDYPGGRTAAQMKYRFQWTFPIVVSPHDAGVLYAGGNVLFRSTNEGRSWEPISPDLTRDDKQKENGGRLEESYCTIFAVTESPLQKGTIWAGSDDGLVHLTRDGGAHWTAVTPASMPAWSRINFIEASPHDAGTAYLAVNRYQLDDFAPYIYKTADYGKTWKLVVAGISTKSFVRSVREDPKRRGLLFAGTETGVYVSFDEGDNWQSLQLNLPVVPVTDLRVKNGDLVIATQGRAFWSLDDITPLEQSSDAAISLFRPRETYRESGGGGRAGQNGMTVSYFFREKTAGPVSIEIADSSGRVIVTRSPVAANPGLNRFTWDMRFPDAHGIQGGTLLAGGNLRGPVAVPGTYRVTLRAGNQSFTETAEIRKNPRSSAAQEDLQSQFDFLIEVRDRLSQIHDAINTIHALQKDIGDRVARAKSMSNGAGVVAAGEKLAGDLQSLSVELYEPRFTGQDDQMLIFPLKLNNRFAGLQGYVSSADAAPTAQSFAGIRRDWENPGGREFLKTKGPRDTPIFIG